MEIELRKCIRQRIGFNENDEMADVEIAKMSKQEKLEAICGWKFGYESWADDILYWLKECGFEVK